MRSTDVTIETLTADIFHLCASTFVPRDEHLNWRFMEGAEVVSHVQRHTGNLVMILTAGVAGELAESKTVTCHWPATWWDAFKERWFPKWARLRWPTNWEERTLTAEVKAIYPELKVPKGMPRIDIRYVTEAKEEC